MSTLQKISTESGIVLFVERRVWEDSVEVIIKAENIQEPFFIHWGLRKEADGAWHVPPERNWPSRTNPFDHAALQTLLKPGEGQIVLKIDRDSGFNFMDFALFFPSGGNWDNNLGRNYRVVLPEPKKPEAPSGKPGKILPEQPEAGGGHPSAQEFIPERAAATAALEAEIARKEMGQNSWTLMHRFNLCYDLLDKIGRNDIGGLALIYVWLRFSALRQLTWQRNYNTKPRELGHALDRLSAKLAGRYREAPEERELIRLIMTTLGRGSDAQRVRDEVLNIMHRRHIKEVSGHFMEEWHQKLHNNATPDDIVICEAYLDFQKSGGDLEVFYKTLAAGGVTKERLESYERPIKSHPDFIADLKGPLIQDFENFLTILKAVHSGADLDTAAQAAERLLDNETKGLIGPVRSLLRDASSPASALAGKIIEARRRLSNRFGSRAEETRDLLFLDMALEDSLRVLIERNLEMKHDADALAELFSLAFENVCLSPCDEEMNVCFRFWERLETLPRFKKAWAIRAETDRERTGRAIGSYAQRMHWLLQPVAGRMGSAFHAEPWAVGLFSEETLRGRPAFALSALLRQIDPLLRESAGMGNWQIISRGEMDHKAGEEKTGKGKTGDHAPVGPVKVTGTLKEIQGQDFSKAPVILVAEEITGDEEIPAGVPAIITPSTIDRLSHLAIRARNAGVFFATCFDPGILEKIRAMEGRSLRLDITAAGEVQFREEEETGGQGAGVRKAKKPQKKKRTATRPGPILSGQAAWAVSFPEFSGDTVGYKSINLKRLVGKLPEWINLPRSAALPFGVFEKALGMEENRDTEKRYRELEEKLGGGGDFSFKETLAELRNTVLELKPPGELVNSLKEVMGKTGLPMPQDWEGAWSCIKRVWASKWNDRAYLNRKANGIGDGDLFMSVLIQEVVSSELSFVIHTANPITLDKEEIYAEAVLGLGEALAGNYPGMPLGFTFKKKGAAASILSMPGKSKGFYLSGGGPGGSFGLIFRSDSNGEDLEGYSGAGLYDSFMLPEPDKVTLDYSEAPIVWDEKLLREFTSTVARTGVEVEKAAGGPQDIEGAYSGGKFYVVQARPQAGIY